MCDLVEDTRIQVTEEVTERVTEEQRIVGRIITFIELEVEKSKIYDAICKRTPISYKDFESFYQQALEASNKT